MLEYCDRSRVSPDFQTGYHVASAADRGCRALPAKRHRGGDRERRLQALLEKAADFVTARRPVGSRGALPPRSTLAREVLNNWRPRSASRHLPRGVSRSRLRVSPGRPMTSCSRTISSTKRATATEPGSA